MRFNYYGHACFTVEVGVKKLLFDPFITDNELAKDIDIKQLEADYILASHGHADHIADLIPIAQNTQATVICSWEIYEWLLKQGIKNIHPMNTGGKKEFDGFTVKCTVAHHSSGLPDGKYGGNPMGFLITSANGNFYYAGDTSLTLDMQLIPKWAKLDFAILPIGDNFTMDIDDALISCQYIECNKMVGVHFDTFGFIMIDHDLVKKKCQEQSVEIHLPKIGSSIEL